MRNSISFCLGTILGLLLTACGASSFSAESGTSQLLSIEVDDSNLAKDNSDSLDASANGAGGGNDAPSSSNDTADESDEGSDKSPDGADCALAMKQANKLIRVAGSQNKMQISSQELVLSRVTGNQNQLEISLKGNTSAAKMAGLCLFIAGNSNKVNITIQHAVAGIFIKARGNQASVNITVAEGSSIGDIQWDSRGNQPSISIAGPKGSYTCPSSKSKGSVSCQ